MHCRVVHQSVDFASATLLCITIPSFKPDNINYFSNQIMKDSDASGYLKFCPKTPDYIWVKSAIYSQIWAMY